MTPPATARIDGHTRVFAVLGNPIGHSLSPVMHNAAFAETGFPGVMVALRATRIGGAMTGIRAMDFGGAAVTLPHKVAVMAHLDEIDPLARRIGAVNTVQNVDGRLVGCNSDCLGAMKALAEKTRIRGKRAALIGAGGAARALGFGLKKEGALLTVYNRSKERGEALADRLDAAFYPLSEVENLSCDILVHTTSVGMAPDAGRSPLPRHLLKKEMTVMDIVYNPLETQLLKWARAAGCQVVDGLSMFVHQGAFQFELWTGRPAPLARMRQSVMEILSPESQPFKEAKSRP